MSDEIARRAIAAAREWQGNAQLYSISCESPARMARTAGEGGAGMSAVLNFNQQLSTLTCYKCGIVFAVPNYFQQKRSEDKEEFYCPNGHRQAFIESEIDRLKRQLEEQKRSTEWWKNSAASKDKTIKGQNIQIGKVKAKLKRTEIRVSNGVCPCCNRSFTNVRRHIKTKHPDYVEGASE